MSKVTEYVSELYENHDICHMKQGAEGFCGAVKTIGIYYFKLFEGGVERVISLLAPLYLEMGYHVVLILEQISNEKDYPVPAAVEKVVIPTYSSVKNSNDYRSRADMLSQIVERYKIDIVCYHAALSDLLYYDCLLFKLMHCGVVIVNHAMFAQEMSYLGTYVCEAYKVYQIADRLIVLSEAEKVFWNSLGVDADYIMNPIEERNSGSYADSDRTVLWVGRLDDEQKQYLDVVEIMKLVHEKLSDVRAIVYGSEYSFQSARRLEDAVHNAGLDGCVIYNGYTRDVNEIYAEASLHLVTSAYEAFPMCIYESKVRGIPMVTYDMPYLELLKGNKGQIIVGQGDIQAAADAVVCILTNDIYRRRLSREALESAAMFSNTEVKNRWFELFDEIGTENGKPLEINQEFNIILKTILFHYERGCLKNAGKVRELQKKNLIRYLQLLRERSKKPFAIYPYGKCGKMVKKLLEETFGQQEKVLLVDNYAGAVSSGDVVTVEELAESGAAEDYTIVLCSNNADSYESVRMDLYSRIPKENVVDLYPELWEMD